MCEPAIIDGKVREVWHYAMRERTFLNSQTLLLITYYLLLITYYLLLNYLPVAL